VERLTVTQIPLRDVANELEPSPRITAGSSSETTAGKTRIFIVGYQDFSNDALASMLGADSADHHVSCIEPDDNFLSSVTASRPDALLIQNESLPLPPERFINAVIQQHPDIRILVFGKGMEDEHLFSLVRTGIHGYINGRTDSKHFKVALDHVLDGNTWIERRILERFISNQQNIDAILESQFNERIERLCEQLTWREIEILCKVAKGLAIKQIAEAVHLSHQGVKMHLAKLFKKFKVSNRNQLILAVFDEISPIEDLSVLMCNGLNKKLASKPARN
jgi:DNA-binding NarL/FixJ family response regulator